MAAARLPADVVALIASGVSTIVASRDAQLKPSVMRAVGSTVTPDGGELTVFLSRPQSRQLLQDLAAGGPIAVVFSQPSTHRSIQVKAARTQFRNASQEDAPLLARFAGAFERELNLAGYPGEMAYNMLAHKLEEVIAVSFAPGEAFEQTPGPRAGTRLELAE